MSIQLGSAYGKVSLDASGMKTGIDGAVKGLKTLGDTALTINDKIRKVADGMQRIGAGMSLALTLPILAFAKSAVKEAARGEAAMTDLNAVIKSTGGIAGVTAKNVEDYANKMQLLTKFSDDEIISGNAMLLTFTKIGKDIFPRASDATLDMAQKFGMDLPQAAITLGKALNDPISGVTALRRIGVMLTDEQEKSIKAFMDVNDVASAQKIILDELSTEVGGVAVAYGTTFAGQVAIFNHRIDDMKEKIGMQLIPALIRFMDSAKPLLDWFASASPATVDLIIKLVGLIAIAGPLSTAIGTLGKVFLFFSASGGGASVVTFITTSLLPALGSLFTFITATAIPAIVAFVVANAAWLIPLALVAAAVALLYFAFKTNFGGITTTIVKLNYIMKYYLGQAVDWVRSKFISLGQGIYNIINGIRTAWLNFVKFLSTPIKWPALPKALTPGSPTPFEIGLRGINAALRDMNYAANPNVIARMMARPAQNISSSNSSTNVFHLSSGLTLRDVDRLMDEKINRFAGQLTKAMA